MPRSLLFLFILAPVLSACAVHAVLPPLPSRDAPLEERRRVEADLTPVSAQHIAGPAMGYQARSFMMLGNGTRVEDPMDLLPAVDGDSPTVRYARSFDSHQGQLTGWTTAAFAGLAVGLGAEMLAIAQLDSSSPNSQQAVTLALGGAAVATVVGLVGAFVGLYHQLAAENDRLSAFLTYPGDLRRRLSLDTPSVPVSMPAVPPSPPLLPASP